ECGSQLGNASWHSCVLPAEQPVRIKTPMTGASKIFTVAAVVLAMAVANKVEAGHEGGGGDGGGGWHEGGGGGHGGGGGRGGGGHGGGAWHEGGGRHGGGWHEAGGWQDNGRHLGWYRHGW